MARKYQPTWESLKQFSVPEWSCDAAGLKAKLPAEKPCEHAYTLKLIF